jgi:hypothetical protein
MAKYGAGWHLVASRNSSTAAGDPMFLTGADDGAVGKKTAGWLHNRREDGTTFWLLPITNPGGRFSGFTGQVFMDQARNLHWETSTTLNA